MAAASSSAVDLESRLLRAVSLKRASDDDAEVDVTTMSNGDLQQIVVAGNALSAARCDAVIAAATEAGMSGVCHRATHEIAARDCSRVEITSKPIASALWDAVVRPIAPELPGMKSVGLSERIRVYSYGPGQRFGPHVDQSDVSGDGATSEYTVLFYLNSALDGRDWASSGLITSPRHLKPVVDRCKAAADAAGDAEGAMAAFRVSGAGKRRGGGKRSRGVKAAAAVPSTPMADAVARACTAPAKSCGLVGGETVFWADHDARRACCAMLPRAGSVLLHGHGDRCMTHEGGPVVSGTKWLLRTDVLYRRKGHE
jgi:hypothetical protein